MVEAAARRRERRQMHRRQAILEAATRIFSDVGYEKATLDSIGEAVGLSKTSLYYYVRSKEELLARLLGGVIEEIEHQAQTGLPHRATASERLERFLQAHVEVVCGRPGGALLARHQDIVLGEAHSRSMRAARKRHERSLEAILEEGVREGSFRPANVRVVAYLILGSLNSAARWHSHVPAASPGAIAAELHELVTAGLRADERGRRRLSRAK